MIALSGDFYGEYQDLVSASSKTILAASKSSVYQKDSVFDKGWVLGSAGGFLGYFDFLGLASKNPEHFRDAPQVSNKLYTVPASDPNNPDSVAVYKLGHQSAANHAINALSDGDWQKAYSIDAFYCHFLTDMFSAGHVRVPRRYLHSTLGLGDLFITKFMHDEDSKNGLWVLGGTATVDSSGNVTVSGSKVWQALGDGHQCIIDLTTFFNKSDPKLEWDDPNTKANLIATSAAMELGGKIKLDASNHVTAYAPNQDNWDAVLNAVAASMSELNSGPPVDPNNYLALKIKPEVFPPGAKMYKESKLSEYKSTMSPDVKKDFLGSNSPADNLGLIGYPSGQNGLLFPAFVRKKAMTAALIAATLADTVPLLDMPQTQTYKLDTTDPADPTPLIDPRTKKQGQQTYPLYVIVEGVLYVRIVEDPTLPTSNKYIPAEYDAAATNIALLNGPSTVGDSSKILLSPPTIRLKGPQQGDMVPP